MFLPVVITITRRPALRPVVQLGWSKQGRQSAALKMKTRREQRRRTWEEMPKGHNAVAGLVRQFGTYCRLEGKLEAICRWYGEILANFLEWVGDVCLDEISRKRCAATAAS